MSEIEKLLRKSGYSEKAIDLYITKKNLYKIKDSNASFLFSGPCGDTMKFFLKIDNNVIIDASFLTIGCVGAHIAGAALAEIVRNKTIEEAEKISEEDILKSINGLPVEKKDCVCLAKLTLLKAIKKFKSK